MKLLALFLGGRAPKANIEVHDVVFLMTENWENDKEKIRSLWFGDPASVHIDAIAHIERVDGFAIKSNSFVFSGDERLWFVNFGAVNPNNFSEYHENGFVVAISKEKAIMQAKQSLCVDKSGRHCDTLLELESCVSVGDFVDNLHLLPDVDGTSITIENCYYLL